MHNQEKTKNKKIENGYPIGSQSNRHLDYYFFHIRSVICYAEAIAFLACASYVDVLTFDKELNHESDFNVV